MFTGIIESLGIVRKITPEQSNKHFEISCSFADELKEGDSIAHNGVCLTVTCIHETAYSITAVEETLLKTNLQLFKVEDFVNLERSMPAKGRFDGHIVQGHIDTIGVCRRIEDREGSKIFQFEYPSNERHITVEKGSICVNGVSLTVVESHKNKFSVAVIPYTYQYTNFQYLNPGDLVNIEFDILGKYIQKILLSYPKSF